MCPLRFIYFFQLLEDFFITGNDILKLDIKKIYMKVYKHSRDTSETLYTPEGAEGNHRTRMILQTGNTSLFACLND